MQMQYNDNELHDDCSIQNMSFSAQSDLNFQYAISQIWLLPIMEASEMQVLGLGHARDSNKG